MAAISAMARRRGEEALPRWPGMHHQEQAALADLRGAVALLDRAEAAGLPYPPPLQRYEGE